MQDDPIDLAYQLDQTNKGSDFEKVKSLILEQLLSDPLNEIHYFNMGSLRYHFEVYKVLTDEEIKTIDHILQEKLNNDPENADILYVLGVFYSEFISKFQAAKYLNKSIHINHEYYKSYRLLSDICFTNFNYYYTAVTYGARYNKIKPDPEYYNYISKKAYDYLSYLKFDLDFSMFYQKAQEIDTPEQFEEAITLLNKRKITQFDNYNPYMEAKYLYKLSKFSNYNKALQNLLEMFDKVSFFDPLFYLEAGSLYSTLNDNENAIKYYTKGRDAYLACMDDMDFIKNIPNVVSYWEPVNVPQNHIALGYSYFLLNDFENCLDSYHRALNLLAQKYNYVDLISEFRLKMEVLFHCGSFNIENYWNNAEFHFNKLNEINNKYDSILIYNLKLLLFLSNRMYDRIIASFETEGSSLSYDILTFQIVFDAYKRTKTNGEANFEKAKALIIKQILSDPLNLILHYYLFTELRLFFDRYPDVFTSEEVQIIENVLLKNLEKAPNKLEINDIIAKFYSNVGKKDLTAKYRQKNNDDSVFNKGDKVYHERYGTGIINCVITTGNDQMLSIQFDLYGKRFLSPKNGLKKSSS